MALSGKKENPPRREGSDFCASLKAIKPEQQNFIFSDEILLKVIFYYTVLR